MNEEAKHYSITSADITRHTKHCEICSLDFKAKDEINSLIIECPNMKLSKINEIMIEKYDIEVTKRYFTTHKNLLPLLLSPKLYNKWTIENTEYINTLDKSSNEYMLMGSYMEQIKRIKNNNLNIITSKQESLKYIYNILFPELLIAVRESVQLEKGKTQFEGMAGVSRVIDTVFNKAMLLEASVGHTLRNNNGSEKDGEEKQGYDTEKIMEIIRATGQNI